MEIRHLRAFVAVAETLHFARAAERLDLSPPALTERIQSLEAGVGVQLLRRSRRSVALTDAGQLFLEEARRALEQVQRAEQVARLAGRGERGILTIGFAPSVAFAGVLARAVRNWRASRPEVSLQLREAETLPQIRALAEGRLDIALVRPPFPETPGIVSLALLREPLILALPEAHPLVTDGPVEPKAIASADFIVPDPETAGFVFYTQMLGMRGGFTPRMVPGGRDLIAVVSLVGLGLGLAVVPGSVKECLHLPGVVYRPLAGPPLVGDIAAAFRRNEAAPAARDFIRHLRKLEAAA
ncbi:LysR substrate-binding domain-containing protein [Pseudoroseomonas globiformis]|uniref:LysR substrate-binding domain-containing protein n=1 Tax=Teichococcus globiformis TaxID=2307229 RepID=A0ABV7G404_9PROT